MSDFTPDYELDRAVAFTLETPGVYNVTVTSDWDTPNQTANGGYLLALVLHAMTDAADHPDPLTASISYFRPPTAGPARIAVSKIRSGRKVSTYEATLLQDDRQIVHAVASFHDFEKSGDISHPKPPRPDYPEPQDCLPFEIDVPGLNFSIAERYNLRLEALPGWLHGKFSGVMEAKLWTQFKDQRPIDQLGLAAIVDGYPPVTLEIGQLASATVQLTVYFRERVTSSWVFAHITTQHVSHGYHEEDVEIWDENGHLVAQSRQLAILRDVSGGS